MLHLIVLGYSLFGMIRFKVKFIHMVRLVNWISCFTIAHSWYITVKFALIAGIMYIFNLELESLAISFSQFNCSLLNDLQIFNISLLPRVDSSLGTPEAAEGKDIERVSSEAASGALATASELFHLPSKLIELRTGHTSSAGYEQLTLSDYLTTHYPIMIARLLDLLGGPYKLLGNRATLMYGFFAIATFIMLAIFPIELLYLNVGFNYIRFVLSDTNCMRDLYIKKRKHLDRLNSWSRNQNSSLLTLSVKKIVNQRKLRCLKALYAPIGWKESLSGSKKPPTIGVSEGLDADRTNRLKVDNEPRLFEVELADNYRPTGRFGRTEISIVQANLHSTQSGSSPDGSAVGDHCKHMKSLIRSLSINQHDQPSYDVKVANENLRRFKPHVRSESWFKISMVVYPIFISFYFSTLTVCLGAIYVIFTRALEEMNEKCSNREKIDLLSIWSPLDRLTFYETQYSVFALSFASSFYCSYYFGTILELHIWIQEIAQQLELCRFVIELSLVIPRLAQVEMANRHQLAIISGQDKWQSAGQLERMSIVEHLARLHRLDSRNIDQCFNDFGGLRSAFAHAKHQLFASQSERLRQREIMAMKLLSKKQTLLRATYVNLNLFFDELHDTRFMTQTILRRTTQLAFGFALMVSITRSQFEFNYIYLTILLLATLAILNLYLVCAASINSSVSN